MNMVMNLVLALQIIAALVMIGLVLIQHGKGADMGASFGSGASGSLFGATGSANFLSRSTAACAAVFFICTLSLAYTANDRPRASTGSVLDRPTDAASAAPVAPVASSSGAGAIPVAGPAASGVGGGGAPMAAQGASLPPAAATTSAMPSSSSMAASAGPTRESAAAPPATAASGAGAIPQN